MATEIFDIANKKCHRIFTNSSKYKNLSDELNNEPNNDFEQFLSLLELTENDFLVLRDNEDMCDGYYCDNCKEELIGNFYKLKYEDVCLMCHQTNPENYKNHKRVIHSLSESYKYEIIYLKKINDTSFVYVVEEQNCDCNNQDIHYYLKYFKNSKIIIDHEVCTYNPYFGIYDITVDVLDETNDVFEMFYREKHAKCSVQIKSIPSQIEKGHNVYSQPSCYTRSGNDLCKDHELGEIIQFKKNEKIMESKRYF